MGGKVNEDQFFSGMVNDDPFGIKGSRKSDTYITGTPDSITYGDVKKHFWEGTTFAYFPTSIDGNKRIHDFKLFKRDGNVTHEVLALEPMRMMLGRVVNHLSESDIKSLQVEFREKSTLDGRLWKDCKVIAFWGQPQPSSVMTLFKELGLSNDYRILVNWDAYTVSEYMNSDLDFDQSTNSNDGLVLHVSNRVLEMMEHYNEPSIKQAELSKRLGRMTIAQYNSIIHPYESKERRDVMDESYDGGADTIYHSDTRDRFDWKDDDAYPFGFFPTDLDNHYELLVGDGGTTHLSLAQEALKKVLGKADSRVSFDYKFHIANNIFDKAYGKGRYWKSANAVSFWTPPSNPILESVVRRLNLDVDSCEIVYDGSGKKSVTISEYLSLSGINKNENESSIKKNKPYRIDKGVEAEIRRYNAAGEDYMSRRYKDLGDMTIAQYNSIIHPYEGKKSEKVMSENNYIEEIKNYTELISESLKRDDFKSYDAVISMLNEAVSSRKDEISLARELDTTNFGILNSIFESRLPYLLKHDKKTVRDAIKMIKEDKTLSKQFKYYNSMSRLNENIDKLSSSTSDVKSLVERFVSDYNGSISIAECKKSNARLKKLLESRGVVPTSRIDDGTRKMLESSRKLLENKYTLSNAVELSNCIDNVIEYAKANKRSVNEQRNPMDELCNFEKNVKENLTEAERSFVRDITDFKTPLAEKRKEKLFNTLKGECVKKVNEMLEKEPSRSDLKELKYKIEGQVFSNESIVKDISKMLEIRDILMSE